MTQILPNTNAYAAVHMWVANHFGKPQKCENCLTTENRMYHWANISHTYKRERSDWLRLCVPCHKRNDVQALGGRIKARARKEQPSKNCLQCNVLFFKNPHLSKAQWESTLLCSRACSTKRTGRMLKGSTQTAETKALKTQKLKERWQKDDWRKKMTDMMKGNQFARKQK